ncbi:hypothetical protein QTJ16_003412 [Diplocarpon rosae]|uniref:Uncharacterized protein n=1 Tax=Diplocarpon rosae TaxID=946125 RepID=A0AAD9T1B9_9HELO|nr:hypothetical protein QTJ16_003412 [Diplocarpon rosae]
MPSLGQKGTGKKGRDRQSRSRNTTPSLSGSSLNNVGVTPYLELSMDSFVTDDEIFDSISSSISSAKELEALLERLNKLAKTVEKRGELCDAGMRKSVLLRRAREGEVAAEKAEEEKKEMLKQNAADEEERGRNKKASKMKKRKDASLVREERPLTHGAHGVAPQDGSHPDRSSPLQKHARKISRERENDSASSSLSPPPGAVATPVASMEIDKEEGDSSSDEHQPPPAPAIPAHQTFGDDPNSFPDPTLYEILPITPGMTKDELKRLFSVSDFPEHDLSEYIPGTPPEKDFSSAKPANQVQAQTFATYLEPYFRPINDDDNAFLRERGNRIDPFVMPRRGKKHYTEIWAEEDGALSGDNLQDRDKLPLNQARGDIESMTDAMGETDACSGGPLLSRLLATMRPEHRASAEDRANGTNGDDPNADLNADLFGDAVQPPNDPILPPATFMPDSNSESWKKATHPKLDHAQVDERIKQELRHLGFLPLDTEPDYDAHYDDEIAARLRYLQSRLKDSSITNGARKSRLADLVKERMAHQEYQTICEDLDTQLQTSYLKRTRTLGKSKKNKRPGGAGGGSHFVGATGSTGMARPGIGDVVKGLMEKRSKWIDTIGGVLDEDANKVRRSKDPGSSIFKPEDMAQYIRKEKESWAEEDDEE